MESRSAMKNAEESSFFLTDLLDTRVSTRYGRLGRIWDLMIVGEDASEVTHVIVRASGDELTVVPWEAVATIGPKGALLDAGSIDEVRIADPPGGLQLKEHVMERKAFDLSTRSAPFVYDVLLTAREGKLTVSGVDLGRGGALRRLGGRRSADDLVPWASIRPIPPNLGTLGGGGTLIRAMSEMRPVDIAAVLEELDGEQRTAVFAALRPDLASDVLEVIAPDYQRHLIMSMDLGTVAGLINRMTPGQAADALSSLNRSELGPVAAAIDPEISEKVQLILGRQEDTAVYYATSRYIRVGPRQTAGDVRDNYAALSEGKDVAEYLYVQDEGGRLLGVVDLASLLRLPATLAMEEIMAPRLITLPPDATLREASEVFSRYEFRAIPVVDGSGAFLGVVPYRDVMRIARNIVE